MSITEEITVDFRNDWCAYGESEACAGSKNVPSKCFILSDQVRICGPCLREIYEDEFPEDFKWILQEAWHEGDCEEVSVKVCGQEVTFCPGCLLTVILENDPKALEIRFEMGSEWLRLFATLKEVKEKVG